MTGSWLLPAMLAVPLAGSVVLLLAGRRADRWAVWLGVAAGGVTLLLALVAVARFDLGAAGEVQLRFDASWVPQLDTGLRFGVDGISLPLVVLTALLSFLCLLYTTRHLPEPGRPRAFVGLQLLLELGMLATFVAQDLLLFFVAFEVVLAPMWFVIAWWGSGDSRRAATVFILYTVFGSLLMLVGLVVIWVATGTTDMVELARLHGAGMSSGLQLFAVVLVGVGLAVKAPMWPLHSWLPDAHTAAPTVGSVLLAGVLLKMGTYGMVRVALPMLPEGARQVAPALAVLAVVGIVYGALASYAQRDLKRLVAFSSVGHMGFVLLGISTLTAWGVNASMFGNVAHGLITGLLFFLAGALKERFHTLDLDAVPRALYRSAPRLGFLLGFAAMASLGLPGLAGFWGEFLALFSAYHPAGSGVVLFRALLAVAALGTVLAAAYFLRVLRRVGQGPSAAAAVADVTLLEATTWLPLAALVLVLGLLPGLLLGYTGPAADALTGSPPTTLTAEAVGR